MSSVNNINEIGNAINLGPTGSLQFQFAKLQLAMAEISKAGALDYMDQIKAAQDEQKKISEMLQTVRQAQADAKDSNGVDLPDDIVAYMKENGLAIPEGSNNKDIKAAQDALAHCKQMRQDAIDGKGNCPWDKHASMMDAEVAKFLRDHGVAYDTYGNDLANNSREWDYNIQQLDAYIATLKPYTAEDLDVVVTSLQSRLDQVGSNTQQLMVFVQDFMGQYNSYLQGSNSVIQQANQTLGELARVR
jgi:EspA-like secreted protein.